MILLLLLLGVLSLHRIRFLAFHDSYLGNEQTTVIKEFSVDCGF